MEIINKPDKIYVCNRCGAKLKITKPGDLKSGYLGISYGIFGSVNSIYGHYLECPYCLNKVIVDYDN